MKHFDTARRRTRRKMAHKTTSAAVVVRKLLCHVDAIHFLHIRIRRSLCSPTNSKFISRCRCAEPLGEERELNVREMEMYTKIESRKCSFFICTIFDKNIFIFKYFFCARAKGSDES